MSLLWGVLSPHAVTLIHRGVGSSGYLAEKKGGPKAALGLVKPCV
jgi:hypothetical protein